MKKYKNGYSLFELLVTISIIAILTAIAVASFSGAQKKSRDARRVEDLKVIQNAAEMYYSLNSYTYPPSSGMPWAVGTNTIMTSFPKDPKFDDETGYANADGTYVCTFDAAANTYVCCARMEATPGNTENLNGTGNPSGNYYCVRNQQ